MHFFFVNTRVSDTQELTCFFILTNNASISKLFILHLTQPLPHGKTSTLKQMSQFNNSMNKESVYSVVETITDYLPTLAANPKAVHYFPNLMSSY